MCIIDELEFRFGSEQLLNNCQTHYNSKYHIVSSHVKRRREALIKYTRVERKNEATQGGYGL